jgi:DNA-binding CsgD family transcriptional regulator
MTMRPEQMRPSDSDAYRQALRNVHKRMGLPLVFGGPFTEGHLVLEEFIGARTDGLNGLHVQPGRGMGGFAVSNRRPVVSHDYQQEQWYTHDYDEPVADEGIRGVVAAPVTVDNTARGVLYGAVRSDERLAGVAMEVLDGIANQLATEIAIRDEVDRRVRLLETAASVSKTGAFAPAQDTGLSLDDLRDLRHELAGIADRLGDQDLRGRLHRACAQLARLDPAGADAAGAPGAGQARLSHREIDVLREVALGCSNAEAAQRLSLRPETVKAYLRSASRKLGTHGRYQVVLAARRAGLLDSI